MTDRDAVRRGYDAQAKTYAAERAPGDEERAVLEGFADRLGPGNRVLNAGCGQGDPVLGLLDDRAGAVGLDFSAAQLELAREAAPSASLVRGDLTALPFAADRFDAAVAAHAVIHLPLGAARGRHRGARPGAAPGRPAAAL
ncbi:MAG: methyltransferase domain-containing protein [Halobacteriales archaeon]|nr:methyltransferase domain-containing protein [Halobacteriales archaeon]